MGRGTSVRRARCQARLARKYPSPLRKRVYNAIRFVAATVKVARLKSPRRRSPISAGSRSYPTFGDGKRASSGPPDARLDNARRESLAFITPERGTRLERRTRGVSRVALSARQVQSACAERPSRYPLDKRRHLYRPFECNPNVLPFPLSRRSLFR